MVFVITVNAQNSHLQWGSGSAEGSMVSTDASDWMERHYFYPVFTRYNWLSNRLCRLCNWFDNRLYRVDKHSTGYQTGCQTGLTTGVTTIQPVVKPVIQPGSTTGWMFVYMIHCVVKPVSQPVWQHSVSCKRGFNDQRTGKTTASSVAYQCCCSLPEWSSVIGWGQLSWMNWSPRHWPDDSPSPADHCWSSPAMTLRGHRTEADCPQSVSSARQRP